MKKIFLISGKAQHGKDTVAKMLQDKLLGRTLILHYADYLKMIARLYLKWDGNKDDTGRTLLQWLGTERVRVGLKNPLFWTKTVCDAIEITFERYDYFCVPDCRFPNEIFYPMARFPGIVSSINVVRVGYENPLSEKQRNHLSETSLDGFRFDYIIESESGLDMLHAEVDKFIEKMELIECTSQ